MRESGYCPCLCRDCFEVAIANDIATGALCGDCESAGCSADGDSDCEAEGAYEGAESEANHAD